jgi:hypothetical protein
MTSDTPFSRIEIARMGTSGDGWCFGHLRSWPFANKDPQGLITTVSAPPGGGLEPESMRPYPVAKFGNMSTIDEDTPEIRAAGISSVLFTGKTSGSASSANLPEPALCASASGMPGLTTLTLPGGQLNSSFTSGGYVVQFVEAMSQVSFDLPNFHNGTLEVQLFHTVTGLLASDTLQGSASNTSFVVRGSPAFNRITIQMPGFDFGGRPSWCIANIRADPAAHSLDVTLNTEIVPYNASFPMTNFSSWTPGLALSDASALALLAASGIKTIVAFGGVSADANPDLLSASVPSGEAAVGVNAAMQAVIVPWNGPNRILISDHSGYEVVLAVPAVGIGLTVPDYHSNAKESLSVEAFLQGQPTPVPGEMPP